MNISWFLGFGWFTILGFIASGVGINLSEGWLRWVLYVPFLLLGLHMSIRFRSFRTQAWRRQHAKAMQVYGPLAASEYAAAKKEHREFDVSSPCRALAEQMFGPAKAQQFEPLLGAGRKAYYANLVDSYSQAFVGGVAPERRDTVLGGVRRDIEASELGPDILIAKRIELEQGGLEAARYLQALLLGRVR
ncbi:hypothetical protein HUU62_07005 [Rhodoferax sp. 4810]|nr:hypothetical protein [Rhodoferax jenense]